MKEVELAVKDGVDVEVRLTAEDGDEEGILDDANSEMSRSDILISPLASYEKDEADSERVCVCHQEGAI
jgi:hypothetical protein